MWARAGDTMNRPSLRDSQAWFVCSIVGDVAPGAREVACWITGGAGLDAGERLDIYRRAYRSRLVECLADDYPVLRYALGVEPFELLALDYIALHPPRSANLNAYGRRMADFCRTRTGAWPLRDFAVELARLEWALVEVIHAPALAVERRDLVADVPLIRFPNLRFSPSTAVRFVRGAYPVNAFFQAFADDQAPRVPEPCPSAVLVYRQGLTVWRMDVDVSLANVLEALLGGARLAEAMNALEESAVEPAAVGAAFRQWGSSGIFSRAWLDDDADECIDRHLRR